MKDKEKQPRFAISTLEDYRKGVLQALLPFLIQRNPPNLLPLFVRTHTDEV